MNRLSTLGEEEEQKERKNERKLDVTFQQCEPLFIRSVFVTEIASITNVELALETVI